MWWIAASCRSCGFHRLECGDRQDNVAVQLRQSHYSVRVEVKLLMLECIQLQLASELYGKKYPTNLSCHGTLLKGLICGNLFSYRDSSKMIELTSF
jgi:hypothetical protein